MGRHGQWHDGDGSCLISSVSEQLACSHQVEDTGRVNNTL